jgi:mRNA-degrading endonuclease RelE of RelBE toxin-antitoxin system
LQLIDYLLGATPNGAIERLRGLSQPQHRLRVGEVRVFYDVSSEAVEVLAIITKVEAARWLAEHGTPDSPSGAG